MNYSIKTTNKSFINMWRYLQRNYVENNLFMLQTISNDLIDFSIEKYRSMNRDDPTFLIYRSKVIEEAKNNIWFYFRELVMIPDETSLSGYKHFELTPESMAMIYLYDKMKSFIIINPDDNLCLNFIWNLHKSKMNTDLVLINNIDKINEISNDIKKHIAHMECHVPFGSTQIMSDSDQHLVSCNLKSFTDLYLKNNSIDFQSYIHEIYNNYFQKNPWADGFYSLFILEKDMPLITYSYVINLINSGFQIYLNGIENKDSIDKIILDNFLNSSFPKIDTSIYDKEDLSLNCLYLI